MVHFLKPSFGDMFRVLPNCTVLYLLNRKDQQFETLIIIIILKH